MIYKDMINVVKNIIDETDEDSQVDVIIKQGINEAYRDLAKVDKRVKIAYVNIINGIAQIPIDCESVIKITPELISTDKKMGNTIITTQTGTFTIIYSYYRDDLVNDNDEPDLVLELQDALITYACYTYYKYRKKPNEVSIYLSDYNNAKSEFSIRDEGTYNEQVRDIYE